MEAIRLKMQVILETWIDDVKPRLPYTKEQQFKLPSRNTVICILGRVGHGRTDTTDAGLCKLTLTRNEWNTHVGEFGAICPNLNNFNSIECLLLDFNVVIKRKVIMLWMN